jgi:hypothetical protein
MTLQEFKAWFDGFTEEMDAAPNKKQWERIKKRVKEIDGAAVSYPVFVDRYWPPVQRYFPGIPYWNGSGASIGQAQGTLQSCGFNMNTLNDGHAITSFNSSQAMLALGKADYQSMEG